VPNDRATLLAKAADQNGAKNTISFTAANPIKTIKILLYILLAFSI
jgi:hypothetical protein